MFCIFRLFFKTSYMNANYEKMKNLIINLSKINT